MSYRHLTKVSERVMKQYERFSETHLSISRLTPEFMTSKLPVLKEDKKFKTIQEWKFLPGDRVVIVKKGAYRGNISVIGQHNTERNGYTLTENGPVKRVVIPKQLWAEGQTSHIADIPELLAQDDLRLVADIDDPAKPGKTKTVAVRDVVFRGSYYDSNFKKMMPYRCVIGQEDLVIPWPKPKFVPDGQLATPGNVAREQTFFVDSVVSPPIPKEALLTIRNPYSKYDRGKLTSRDIARLVAPKMPLTETKKALMKEKQKRAHVPRPKFTEEDKILIGSHAHRALFPEAADI